ncbi:MAG: hypothetical protein RID53_24605 [Coleofasciculus sp. B1-GNL1-01]|uniref:hypothetical protein n=1 Tax=Coleofasciculus sp. B1-GNL1-01 TaxID=3068484 RepID=UPI0033016C3C
MYSNKQGQDSLSYARSVEKVGNRELAEQVDKILAIAPSWHRDYPAGKLSFEASI